MANSYPSMNDGTPLASWNLKQNVKLFFGFKRK